MKELIQVNPIGKIHVEKGVFYIRLKDEYKKGLVSIDGFSHLQIVWWGNLGDDATHRSELIVEKPYKKGPSNVGVFATRAQFRPNPILITTVFVTKVDFENGIIYTPYIDAENETPVLDIKPYHFYERVEGCQVPNWCRHWPSSYEKAAYFDWENEFNF